jgi:hypothetical protein
MPRERATGVAGHDLNGDVDVASVLEEILNEAHCVFVREG